MSFDRHRKHESPGLPPRFVYRNRRNEPGVAVNPVPLRKKRKNLERVDEFTEQATATVVMTRGGSPQAVDEFVGGFSLGNKSRL